MRLIWIAFTVLRVLTDMCRRKSENHLATCLKRVPASQLDFFKIPLVFAVPLVFYQTPILIDRHEPQGCIMFDENRIAPTRMRLHTEMRVIALTVRLCMKI